MKVLCLSGSPRNRGNTAVVLDEISNVFEEYGHKVKRFELNKLNFRGCQACMACKTANDYCILKDDLSEILDDVKESDIVVLGSPVYFGDVTAQSKAFIDRTYSFLKPDFYTSSHKSRLQKGKKIILALQQGAPEDHFSDIYKRYKMFFDWQFDETILIRECKCVSKDTVSKSKKKLENIRSIVSKLL